MRTFLITLALLTPCFCFSQTQYSKEQFDRLADAGKVYGYIKYFHPGLQYSKLNWDSTFAANVEPILNARNKEEYAAAMQHLLDPLNDDLTTVANAHADKNYQLKPTSFEVKDSILYFTLNDMSNDWYGKVQSVLKRMGEAKGLVFDLRRPVNSKYFYDYGPGPYLYYIDGIFKGDAIIPAFRSITYDNLPSEQLRIFTGAYFKQGTTFVLHENALKKIPIVFIVTDAYELPSFAVGLQQIGQAAIIAEKGKRLLLGTTTSFYLKDSVLVRLRLTEGINADGSLAIVHPNATYEPSAPGAAIAEAKEMIISGIKPIVNKSETAPLLKYQSSLYGSKNYYPSLGYRILAAAKIFSTIDHFHPAKDLMDRNWSDAYRSTLPLFVQAKDSLEYMRAVAELYSTVQDSHGFIAHPEDGFSLRLNPTIQGRGNRVPPVYTRVVEGKVVIYGIYDATICEKISLQLGDVILSIDGRDPIQMIDEARKYQCASTKASQTFFVCNFVLFGNNGEVKKLKVQGADGKVRNVTMPVLGEFGGNWWSDPYAQHFVSTHITPTYRLLSKDIVYADLTSGMQPRDFDSLYKMYKNTKTIIFDVRGYPNFDGDAFKFQLKNRHGLTAEFHNPHPSAPNVDDGLHAEMTGVSEVNTSYQKVAVMTNPTDPVYRGKVIVLANESNQSWGDHICVVFKAMCNATLIGAPTSGTDGGFNEFDIPGDLILWFTGSETSFPDGTRIQRRGVKPDISVYPTIKGIQAGKDEVLDRAIKYAETGK